jgi:hypothetical protein
MSAPLYHADPMESQRDVSSDPFLTTAPLPVMQLRTWTPVDEPLHFAFGFVCVLAFIGFLFGSAGALPAVLAALMLTAALWRFLLPIRYELDARGVQEIVLGHRSFWRWNEFVRYEIDPQSVCLIGDARDYPLVRAASVTLFSEQRHLELVHLVATYLGPMVGQTESTIRQPAQAVPSTRTQGITT